MGKERQLRQREATKNEILDAAREIVFKEGFQGLSVRKITNQLDYSPAIIYHYFKNKNEIIETLVSEGYKRIFAAVSSITRNEDEPEKEIREAFTNLLKAALDSSEEYKAVMLNDDAAVLQKTALLKPGVPEKSPTLKMLCENLRRGIGQGRYSCYDPELTAQVLWTAIFGLIIKVIIEKDVSQEQINRLLDHHFTVLFNGILKR
ncbi:TetR/AcrR family transcriptional regulator [Metallumcola ferriviriculae]|uniref:TetR/AcrR family transcriptional regulator n=1 Tax=Metallumcola ferriviriculae TaxID=3039180 RepID=A0AAU0UMA0_9FIRM|nr:TetR/AcrR family transcriptional regulator [Desulfitibacteraceae bacterium MK1]